MKPLRFIILILILWNIPSFLALNSSYGSVGSFSLLGLLLIYFLFSVQKKIMFPLIIIGSLYFIISGLVYVEDQGYFINEFVKYLILIVGVSTLIQDTHYEEFLVIVGLGALSIIIHAVFFQDDFGRYSGLYLDPNGAGFVCLIAYCLTFYIDKSSLKLPLQFIITIAGIMTFSRTFILLWVIANLIAIVANKKNIYGLALGFFGMIVTISVSAIIKFDTIRFSFIQNLINNNSTSDISTVSTDSRFKTWSIYYSQISENLLFGSGFRSLSGSFEKGVVGVHNTYLMIIGESGIIPFVLIISLFTYLLIKSFKQLKETVSLFLLTFACAAFMLTTHNYFENHFIIFITIWVFYKVTLNASNLKLL